MENRKKILMVEDEPDYRLSIRMRLESGGFKVMEAENGAKGLDMARNRNPDLILLDLMLPDSKGLETFKKMQIQEPDVPIVVLSALSDEGLALQAVQKGAQDYLVKGQVDGSSLVRALYHAIERKKLILKLRDALDRVNILRGLLPICAECKKIRDDRGYWHEVEEYIKEHSEADFSHGYCPECAKKVSHELNELKSRKEQVSRGEVSK